MQWHNVWSQRTLVGIRDLVAEEEEEEQEDAQ